MTSFIPPIAFFIVILSIGVICGGITYVFAYRSKTRLIRKDELDGSK